MLAPVIKALPFGIAVFDSGGRLHLANSRWCRLFGVKERDARSLVLKDLHGDGPLERVRSLFLLFEQRPSEEHAPINLESSDDHTGPITVFPLQSEGSFHGLLVMEDVPRGIVSKLEATFSGIVGSAVVVHRPDGKIVYATPELAAMVGIGQDEILQKDITDLEYGLTKRRLADRLKRLRQKGGQMTFRTRIVSRAGNNIPCRAKDLCLGVDTMSLIISMFTPTRAQDQLLLRPVYSELAGRAFEAIPLPAFVWERVKGQTVLRMYNRAAYEFTDGRIANYTGLPVGRIFPRMPEIDSAITHTLETHHPIGGEIPCACNALGMNGIFVFSFSWLAPKTVLMTVMDITRHIRTQRRLERQTKELSAFAHDVNHDVKNLLQQILIEVDLLTEDHDRSRAERVVELVGKITRVLQESVELADAGQIIGRPVVTPLERLVREASELLGLPPRAVSMNALPTVRCDPSRILRVFLNLFSNAIQHGKARSIRVRWYPSSRRLTVSNDGVLVDEEIRRKMFRERVSSDRQGGRGLLIVRRIIDAHGWSIRLLDTKRTTFEIRIPAHAIVDDRKKAASEGEPEEK